MKITFKETPKCYVQMLEIDIESRFKSEIKEWEGLITKKNLAAGYVEKDFTFNVNVRLQKACLDGLLISCKAICCMPLGVFNELILCYSYSHRAKSEFVFKSNDFTKSRNEIGEKALMATNKKIKAKIEEESAIKAKKEAELQKKQEVLKKEKRERAIEEAVNLAAAKIWADENGSELLQKRIKLGFEFETLLTSEYFRFLMPNKIIIKDEDVNYNDLEYTDRPSLELLSEYEELRKTNGLKIGDIYEDCFNKSYIFFEIAPFSTFGLRTFCLVF